MHQADLNFSYLEKVGRFDSVTQISIHPLGHLPEWMALALLFKGRTTESLCSFSITKVNPLHTATFQLSAHVFVSFFHMGLMEESLG